MPKLGYTTIVVKESVRGMLEEIAKTQGYRSINQFFEALDKGSGIVLAFSQKYLSSITSLWDGQFAQLCSQQTIRLHLFHHGHDF